MANFVRSQFPAILCISILLVASCLCAPVQQLTSCLRQYNIRNFTTFPGTGNDPTTYYEFLDFSIQNLRFMDPGMAKPVAVIVPGNREELVNCIKCCREGSLEITVRCGGHSYEGTSSVARDGDSFVIIDMMKLNKVYVDLETETAWVEGGATLGETYSAIAEHSSVHGFSAGSCPTVGVGGHIQGGGFGMLSRKYGLAADNVVDALLIDANGRLLDRKAMGEDVFWAIRGGGGGSWGIVYAWKIKLLKVPRVITGFMVNRTDLAVAKLLHKWQYVAPNLIDDFYLSGFVCTVLPEPAARIELSATFKGLYLGPRTEALQIINRFFPELGIAERDCKEMKWIESILYFSGRTAGTTISDLKSRKLKDKNYFKAKSDYVRTEIPFTGIQALLEILVKEPKGHVVLDPYGGMMHRISSEAIAFPHRKGNLFTIQYLVDWTQKDDNRSNEYISWIRELYRAMTPYVSWGPRAAYVNFMDFDLGVMGLIDTKNPTDDPVEIARVWGEKYFLKNFDRLMEAKTEIDPLNVFHNQQSIPPKARGDELVVP